MVTNFGKLTYSISCNFKFALSVLSEEISMTSDPIGQILHQLFVCIKHQYEALVT